MTIEKILEAGKLTLKPVGRLDTITSPELKAALDEHIGDISSLVFDFNELMYISSAGLRVLVYAKKMMQDKPLVITGISNVVREAMEITGLIKAFDVV